MKTESNPLTVTVYKGVLTISIGVETLEFCTRPENGGTLNGCRVDRRLRKEFANDVANEMMREDEQGYSPLNRFLDQMIEAAANMGSGALIWPKERRRHAK